MASNLSAFVSIFLNGFSLMLIIPSLVLCIECVAALFSATYLRSLTKRLDLPDDVRVSVIIPAHNEELVLGATLESVMAQVRSPTDLVVVADNCSDATADIARRAGATVVERQDLTRQGKSYALEAGLEYLAKNPPDVVVLIDADCMLQAHTISALVQQARTTQRPAQAIYLMHPPNAPSPKDQLSAFAFTVKNLARPIGLWHLGWPCQLTGTGMAFPWHTVSQFDLSANHLVEDMKLGYDLAIANVAPTLCPEARVTGCLPGEQAIATGQRTRWEHGHLSMMRSYLPRLLFEGIRQRRVELLVLACDLTIPPVSLLVLLWGMGCAIAVGAAWFGLGWSAAATFVFSGIAIAVAIALAWWRFARAELTLRQLVAIGGYLLWKIPIGLTFFSKPQTTWVRTARDSE